MAVTSVQEALNILNGLVSTQKVENEGINDQGKLSSEEWNAVVVVVNSLLKLGGHTNVADAVDSNAALNDQVLYRAAGESEWRIISVDSVPTNGSDNPVASGGVYIRLDAIAQTISELADNIAYVGEDDGEGGVPTGGGSTPVDLTDYALKTWVSQNFLGKTSMDTTPTANSANPVTSGGVKQYVDSHGGGGGGSTITTFNITVDFFNQNSVVCDFGTTKFSEVANAIANSDIVQLIGTEINNEQSSAALVFTHAVSVPSSLYVFKGLYSSRLMYIAVSEGNNDSIISSYSHIEIPGDLSELNDDSTHRTVSDAEKTTWNNKVTVFNATTVQSQGNSSYDFGTTKFSDILNATQNSDEVILVVDGFAHFRFAMNFNGGLLFSSAYYLGNGTIVTIGLSQGDNDSINSADEYVTIPASLRDLSGDSTHRTVTDAEKTKWNAATKGLEKIAEADIDNAITAGIYEVNESTAPGVPYLLMVEVRSSTETIEDPVSGEVISSIMHLYYFQTRLRNNVISRRQRVDVGSWSAWEDVTDNTKADKVTSATANNAAALDANGNLKDSGVPAAGIPFGRVDSTSTATAFTATVPGITELRDGICVLLENGVVTSAAGFTLNINGLGAKPSFNNMTAATRDTTIFNVNYTMLFVYDATRVVDGITGAWCCYRGYDGNTNTLGYQIRTNSSTLPVSDQTGRYRLLFTSADGSKYVPSTTSTSTNATSSRAVNQRPIDPHGAIVYYSSTTVLSANGNVGTSSQWQQYTLTLGYSFNRTGAALVLSYPKPVYVKCTPQADGSAIIDADTPYVQALPTTADGKIYIHLGRAYSATAIELTLDHPVYHYYNGAIRRWLGPV